MKERLILYIKSITQFLFSPYNLPYSPSILLTFSYEFTLHFVCHLMSLLLSLLALFLSFHPLALLLSSHIPYLIPFILHLLNVLLIQVCYTQLLFAYAYIFLYCLILYYPGIGL